MAPRLLKTYKEKIIPEIKTKFNLKNGMAVPRIDKIVVNMGVGEAISDIKVLETSMDELSIITGQKPCVRRAKKAISNFKLREGLPVGCKVTLRRDRMYEFMDRLVNVALPRIRDFNGLSQKSFDAKGNYTFGIADQAIFPEIDTGKLQRTQGMNITFVFNHGPKDQTAEILRLLGVPFSK